MNLRAHEMGGSVLRTNRLIGSVSPLARTRGLETVRPITWGLRPRLYAESSYRDPSGQKYGIKSKASIARIRSSGMPILRKSLNR